MESVFLTIDVVAHHSGLAIDIYITLWWCVEGAIAVILSDRHRVAHSIIALALLSQLALRLIDMFFVLFSVLLKGYYRRETDWLSGNRITLLTVFNALETMFVFGIIYFTSAELCDRLAGVTPCFVDLFDAIYFSVVTGTTLGYGTPAPSAPISKALAMVEALFLRLVVIVLISHVRGQTKIPPDLELEAATKLGAAR